MTASRRKRVALAYVLIEGIGILALATGCKLHHHSALPPPWRAGPMGCRSDTLAHVHDPTRLDVLAKCVTVTGTVRESKLVRAFGDLKITIAPDRKYRRYLQSANKGLLIADVIPPDEPFVMRPRVGEHVTVWGAWVLNKGDHTVAVHPAWSIEVKGRAEPPPLKTLEVTIDMPRAVPVGRELNALVRVRSRGRHEAESQTRLFSEIASPGGEGQAWKAGYTNTLGRATLRFVTLEIPGPYTFSVYAIKGRRYGVAETSIKIRRK